MRMNNLHVSVFLILYLVTVPVESQLTTDAPAMYRLKASLGNPESLGWSNPDPCKWAHVECNDNRVSKIQIGDQNLKGTLPAELNNLTELTILEVMRNQLTGPLPILNGLINLRQALFNDNNFSNIPSDFFSGFSSLETIYLDNNPFSAWEITEDLTVASGLQNFSANGANVAGQIPDFLGDHFVVLKHLHLAFNNLQDTIPSSLASNSIETLWLNNQMGISKLSGSIAVLQSMSSLTQVWLHGNQFTGTLPDFSRLSILKDLNLKNNQLTGIVPPSLISLPELAIVNLTANLLQGPTPKFDTSKVAVDMIPGTNSFCLDEPGVACNIQVDFLLSIVESFGYPVFIAQSWKGNDPCNINQRWKGITCNDQGNITDFTFKKSGLSGTISPNFYKLPWLEILLLANNSLTGTIPNELTLLPKLKLLDVSYNLLTGKVPKFRENVTVITIGNRSLGE